MYLDMYLIIVYFLACLLESDPYMRSVSRQNSEIQF
jgi:hypothetical protein